MDKASKARMRVFAAGLSLLFSGWAASGWAVGNNECLDCHGDESLTRSISTGMRDSLHVSPDNYKYSVHNVNGIGCVDCHADITGLDWDSEVPHAIELAPVLCESCHAEVGEAYANSVHKKAGSKGITIPCYACHAYHDTTPLVRATVSERQNSFCLKCHNPSNYHDWLPQKESHFAFVECIVCHAPESPRQINLRFYDLVESKFLDGDVILRSLGTDPAGFLALIDRDGNGIISVNEFEDFVLMLRQRDIRGVFHGELVANIGPQAHEVNRGQVIRDCAECHTVAAPFFQSVKLTFAMDDGTMLSYEVERDVLQTYFVELNILGSARVRLLDRIGIFLIAGGVSVVVVHLSARLLTAPLRRKRKEEQAKSQGNTRAGGSDNA